MCALDVCVRVHVFTDVATSSHIATVLSQLLSTCRNYFLRIQRTHQICSSCAYNLYYIIIYCISMQYVACNVKLNQSNNIIHPHLVHLKWAYSYCISKGHSYAALNHEHCMQFSLPSCTLDRLIRRYFHAMVPLSNTFNSVNNFNYVTACSDKMNDTWYNECNFKWSSVEFTTNNSNSVLMSCTDDGNAVQYV